MAEMSIIDLILSGDIHNEAENSPFYQHSRKYWNSVKNAHENGKKLIAFSGSMPVEILYAMDCIPLSLDYLAAEISKDQQLSVKLIEEAERRLSPNLCGLNKALMGLLMCDELKNTVDAFIYASVMCNSSNAAYYAFNEILGLPSFHFDMPAQKSERAYRYLAEQFNEFIEFLENQTGKKLDWEKVKHHMEQTNRSNELMEECQKLRQSTPCSLSSHFVDLSGLMALFSPTEEMSKLLSGEISECREKISRGFSPCIGGEKHRVYLMHSMLGSGPAFSEFLEREYSAVTVLDGLKAAPPVYFNSPDDKNACYMDFSKKLFSPAMIHGSAESSLELTQAAVTNIESYGVDTVIMLGNRGCRHTLASAKMITDTIYEKFGLPALLLDVDSMDSRYKSDDEIKTLIAEYMDTVVNGK